MKSFQITHVAGVNLNPNGGMGRVAFQWRNAFLSRGHSFHHIGPQAIGRQWHYSTFGLQAAQVLRSEAITSDALLLHESAAWAFRAQRCPTVVFSHGLEARFAEAVQVFEDGRKLHKRLFAKLYQWLIIQGIRRADLVLVLNDEDKCHLERVGIDKTKLRVFRNGVASTPLAAKRQEGCRDVPVVLFNASWIKRKGTSVLIQAATTLFDAGLEMRWMLVGTGKNEEAVLGEWPEYLRSYVTVVPSFSPSDELFWLEQADIFVLPSYFEGLPLSLLQAMESGLACVTTNCCGQRDVIRNGQNGCLFEPGDSRALHNYIKTLIEEPKLRYRLGQAAARGVKNQSWEVVSNEVVDSVINQISGRRFRGCRSSNRAL